MSEIKALIRTDKGINELIAYLRKKGISCRVIVKIPDELDITIEDGKTDYGEKQSN